MSCGDGKVRLCINVPAEVYQRLCKRAREEKVNPCDIVVKALFWHEQQCLSRNIMKNKWDAMWSKPFDHPEMIEQTRSEFERMDDDK